MRQTALNDLTHILEMLIWVRRYVLRNRLESWKLFPKASSLFNIRMTAMLPLIWTTVGLVFRWKSWIFIAVNCSAWGKTIQWMLAWPIWRFKEIFVCSATCENVFSARCFFARTRSRSFITIWVLVWMNCFVNILVVCIEWNINVLHCWFTNLKIWAWSARLRWYTVAWAGWDLSWVDVCVLVAIEL